jgi:type I protein arginine methyltransferase
MSSLRLQRFTAFCFSALRRMVARADRWVRDRPRLAAWFDDRDDAQMADESYRDFNGRHFAGFGQQERMLADKPRMDFYHAAIARHIQPGDRVVDLGTGTGILAAFAARRGASKVYAIDHSKILEHARTLAVANGIGNVEFVATHSTEFKVEERVDVIVHEQMGDCLFDEAIVANVTDLRDRVLKPGGLILPSVFEFYCEPVKLKDSRHVPFIWELNVHGYDYSRLEWHRPQEPAYYHSVSCDPTVVEHFLTRPAPALTIDLHTLNESDMPHEVRFTRPVINAGRLDGYAIFFRARVDDDLCLGSGPLDPGRAPHWGFRILRTSRMDFAAGDVMEVTLTAGRWPDPDTWRWSQTKRTASEQTDAEQLIPQSA